MRKQEIENMGFFKDMQMKYSLEIVRALKQYSTLLSKLARIQNKRNFLLNCRRMNINIPCTYLNIIHLDVKHCTKKLDNIKEEMARKLLNLIISEAITEIQQLKIQKENLEIFIFTYLSTIDAGGFITKQDLYYKTQYNFNKLGY